MAGEKYGNAAIISLLGDIRSKIEYIKENSINKDDFNDLLNKVNSLEENLDNKEDSFSPGKGLEMTQDRILNVTLDVTVFFVDTSLPETPTEDQKKKICLIPGTSTSSDNEYIEYVWVVDSEHPNGYWEEIGKYKAEIDLSGYATKEEVNTKQSKTDESLTTTNKTIVGAINEINSKPTGVGKIDSNSDGTGEIFNDYTNNKATGTNAHAEGSYTEALGYISHAEGFHTKASKLAEHAQGKYNISNNESTDDLRTIHSIGIGTSDSERKNAQEVMTNGDHYIINIGGYNGTNPSDSKTLQEIINNLVNNVPVITEQTLSDNYEIPVNATNQEYIYKLTIGDTLYNITGASGITWQNGVAPITQVNKTYMISVINNLATWGEF